MKATTFLEKQHRIVEGIFKSLAKSHTNKPSLLKELADNLAAHMAIEQDLFYPAVKSLDPELVSESYEEHALAEIALKRLLATDPGEESFQARVAATKLLVQHHLDEEEESLFPEVEKRLAKSQLEDLCIQMKSQFDEVVAQGYESQYPKSCDRTSSDISLQQVVSANSHPSSPRRGHHPRARA